MQERHHRKIAKTIKWMSLLHDVCALQKHPLSLRYMGLMINEADGHYENA
jgi:hypothetical protein